MPSTETLVGVSRDVNKVIKNIDKPRNIRITVRGAVVNMNQSFTRFAIGLLLSIALVYLILMAQFTSFVDPFIILMAIPPGLAGVVLILLTTAQHAEHHVVDGCDHDDRHRGLEQHFNRRICGPAA